MKVALLQVHLEPRGTAANVQRLAAIIDEAARSIPAPDLCVLPGSCDAGGGRSARDRSPAVLQAVREAIAAKAREWGLHIAAGLHYSLGEELLPAAALFDPDGDTALTTADPAPCSTGESGRKIALWPTTVGSVGVFTPAAGWDMNGFEVQPELGGLIAWPFCTDAVARLRREHEQCLDRVRSKERTPSGAFWAVTVPAGMAGDTEREPPCSAVIAPDGAVVAAADSSGQQVLFAEVVLATAKKVIDSCGEKREAN